MKVYVVIDHVIDNEPGVKVYAEKIDADNEVFRLDAAKLAMSEQEQENYLVYPVIEAEVE